MTTLIEFFNDVYQPFRLLGKSKRTVELYSYSIRLFEKTLGRPPLVSDLNDVTVGKHLQGLISQGRKPVSVRKEQWQLNAIWRFAADRGLLKFRPTLAAIPVPEKIPRAWTKKELGRLFQACRTAKGTIEGIPADVWFLALHRVLWDTGERIGAVRAAVWGQVVGDWLEFPAATRKGGRDWNRRKLHKETIATLGKLRILQQKRQMGSSDNQRIFCWKKSESLLYYRYGLLLKSAGLPHGADSKFHRMRKSVGSHIQAGGGNAQHVLGHSDPKTTKRYIDPRISPPVQPADELFRAG